MRPPSHSHRIAILAAILIASALLTAQQPSATQKQDGTYTYHADTHLVLLDVTVTDKHGQPVIGLTQDNFKLLEDGQLQSIKFFEEHTPIDPAELARQRAAALAAQPPNTFTNYEPFTGRPVTVLLLNELFPFGAQAAHQATNSRLQQMLQGALRMRVADVLQKSPPDTPFAVYLLDSELHLVQPVTTDRALIMSRIDVVGMTPHFGSDQLINPAGLPVETEIPTRRKIMVDAMQQLATSLKGQPGRKNLYVFTGGFQCSVVGSHALCPKLPFPTDNYLCDLMDVLEQGRMSIYRYYLDGEIGYGFGCATASANLGSSANYYTLYYVPTNADWDGKYRATSVELPDKALHLAYRKGYFGTPENVNAHYYTDKRFADTPLVPVSGSMPTIAATVVAAGTAGPDRPPAHIATNPAAATFTVQVVPAAGTIIPSSATNSDDKEKQEYRQLTLHISMPASEFKVTQSDSGLYAAQLEMSAVGYAGGRLASENGSESVQMVVNFNSATDPRIANYTITAALNVNVLEHDKNRWVYVSVRDRSTGQFGSLVIPMNQVHIPTPQ